MSMVHLVFELVFDQFYTLKEQKMKTTGNFTGGFDRLLLLVMLGFFFMATTSCEKDDSLANISSMNVNSTQRIGNPNQSQVDRMAPILTIRHESARTSAHDYIFIVYPNGKAIFTGIRNVAVVGEHQVSVSKAQFNMFLNLMENSNFFEINDDNIWTPDLPLTVTTYTAITSVSPERADASRTKSLVDFNNGTPAELFNLRNSVEKIFDISKLVGPGPGPVISTSTPELD